MPVRDDLAARREKLSPAKRALLESRLRGEASGPSALLIQPRADPTTVPLSFTQARFWLFNQIDPLDPRSNVANAYRLIGQLDRSALRGALQTIVDRHAVLRSNFIARNGIPQQIIRQQSSIELRVFDFSALPDAERHAQSRRLVRQEIQRPFDLASDLLLRPVLIKLADHQHDLILIRHHIAMDGWSLGIICQELFVLYRHAAALPDLPVEYADYAAWQLAQFDRGALDEDLAYWRQQLAGPLPILEVPTDHPRPRVQTWSGSQVSIVLPPTLAERLRDLSRSERATLFMTLLASFDVLLYRYTSCGDLLVGAPIANRLQVQTEKTIGPFINMLAIRSRLSGDLSFRDLLSQVRESALDAYQHQAAPFEKIIEAINPDRNSSHSPVFQVMFQLRNTPPSPLKLEGLHVEEVEIDSGVALYDLSLEVVEQAEGLCCRLEYNTDLFEADTIRRMLAHYQNILSAVVADPDRPIAALPMLTEVERQQLLIDWNQTAVTVPSDRCLQHLFEDQVKRTPDRIAVVFKDAHLTYAELNARANQVARHLIKRGVKPDDLVAIYLDPSLEAIVGILGVLKAGGGYVPIDPSSPSMRLEFMLHDSAATIIITEDRLARQLSQHPWNILRVDADRMLIEAESSLDPITACRSENLAYVMYTSGSTGQPKGVMIEHRSVVNNALYCIQMLGLQLNDRVLQFASISFDSSIEEIFPTLLSGAGLVLRPKDLELNLKDFLDFARDQRVTVLEPPTAFWHQLTRDLVEGSTRLPDVIRLLFVGGEKASAAVLAAWLKIEGDRVRWLNGYGPTEATASVITYEAPAALLSIDPQAEVPIGRPDPNTQAYILDDHLQPVPIGVPGELYIGGVCLARGYLNQPELTAQKFIPHPFGDQSYERVYKTGDLARYRPDGNIEIIGRADGQVKLRGLRIELGEIEGVMLQQASIHSAVVTTREVLRGEKQLVAYVVLKEDARVTPSELQRSLRPHLPDYMIPAVIVIMPALPLTLTGKIDYRALPEPDRLSMTTDRAFVGPRTPIEAALVRLWRQLLQLDQISVRSNFFELGGHSLLAARLFSQIEQEFQRKLPLVTLFQAPTLEQLAEVIQQTSWSALWSPLVAIQSSGSKPPLFLVHGFGGGVIDYARLVPYLDPEQPIYGLQARGLNGVEEPDTQIETMAARYINALQTVQPHGPYRLGGYCYGGTVAYEMAQQLQAQGECVTLLALIETAALKSGYRQVRLNLNFVINFFRNLPTWLNDYWKLGLKKTFKRARSHLRLAIQVKKRQPDNRSDWADFNDLVDDVTAIPREHRHVMEIHFDALRNYWPQQYHGKVCVLRARRHPLVCSFDPLLGWLKYADEVQLKLVAGSHDTILNEPYVQTLGAELAGLLNETQNAQ